MEISTFNFTGDAITYLGLVGIVSAFVIVITSFRRFFNSPYNIRVSPSKVTTETANETDSTVS